MCTVFLWSVIVIDNKSYWKHVCWFSMVWISNHHSQSEGGLGGCFLPKRRGWIRAAQVQRYSSCVCAMFDMAIVYSIGIFLGCLDKEIFSQWWDLLGREGGLCWLLGLAQTPQAPSNGIWLSQIWSKRRKISILLVW